jgi:pimeloyl-ACP methyl ester carboxylesterase
MAAEAAKASYEKPRQTINDTGIYYSFGGGILHIAYSGTQHLVDVLADLSILPNFSGCHSGFSDRAKSLFLTTLNIIDTYANGRDIQIILCGHSLGGAIAQILCAKLQGRYRYLMAITFGSPKVYIMCQKD